VKLPLIKLKTMDIIVWILSLFKGPCVEDYLQVGVDIGRWWIL
jgi:hypothetical protein